MSAPLYAYDGPVKSFTPTGPPDATGWQTGDYIRSIDGRELLSFTDLVMEAALNDDKQVLIELERPAPDGSLTRYISPITPAVFGDSERSRFGVAAYEPALVDFPIDGMPAAQSGIEPGDEILFADGHPIDRFSLIDYIQQAPQGTPIQLLIRRNGATTTVTTTPEQRGLIRDVAFNPPLNPLLSLTTEMPLTVKKIPGDFAERTGLRAKDTLTTVNGQPATLPLLQRLQTDGVEQLDTVFTRRDQQIPLAMAFTDLLFALTGYDLTARPEILNATEEFQQKTGLKPKDIITQINGEPASAWKLAQLENTNAGQTVSVEIDRPEIGYGILRDEDVKAVELPIDYVGQIGITWRTKLVFQRVPPLRIVPEAFKRSYEVVRQTILTVVALITSEKVNTKDLGGPILIYQMTTLAARAGWGWFLKITAVVSINLFIFNLLPLPVLDGGLLTFLGIEAVRGKPLSNKVQERIQQVGLVFIVGLVLFVSYNDIMRLIDSIVP